MNRTWRSALLLPCVCFAIEEPSFAQSASTPPNTATAPAPRTFVPSHRRLLTHPAPGSRAAFEQQKARAKQALQEGANAKNSGSAGVVTAATPAPQAAPAATPNTARSIIPAGGFGLNLSLPTPSLPPPAFPSLAGSTKDAKSEPTKSDAPAAARTEPHRLSAASVSKAKPILQPSLTSEAVPLPQVPSTTQSAPVANGLTLVDLPSPQPQPRKPARPPVPMERAQSSARTLIVAPVGIPSPTSVLAQFETTPAPGAEDEPVIVPTGNFTSSTAGSIAELAQIELPEPGFDVRLPEPVAPATTPIARTPVPEIATPALPSPSAPIPTLIPPTLGAPVSAQLATPAPLPVPISLPVPDVTAAPTVIQNVATTPLVATPRVLINEPSRPTLPTPVSQPLPVLVSPAPIAPAPAGDLILGELQHELSQLQSERDRLRQTVTTTKETSASDSSRTTVHQASQLQSLVTQVLSTLQERQQSERSATRVTGARSDKSESDLPTDFLLTGQRLYSKGLLNDAQIAFEAAMKSAPTEHERVLATYLAGSCARKQNRWAESAEHYRQAAQQAAVPTLANMAKWQLQHLDQRRIASRQ